MPIRTESGSKLTYEDYVLIPADGRRHEILDGEHHVSPAPSTHHQRLVGRLFVALHAQVTAKDQGEVFFAPFDVELARFDIVQPDLVAILKRNLHLITPVRLIGVPDLVVEVLSTSTSRRDRGTKKHRYVETGVPEYWIVDGKKRSVQHFILHGHEYEIVDEPAQVVSFLGLPGVRVELSDIW